MSLVPQYDPIQFGEAALKLRSYRQELLASNLVNSDTPGYKARDIRFGEVLKRNLNAEVQSASLPMAVSNSGHMVAQGHAAIPVLYRSAVQPAMDGNTVDPDVERSQFMKNSFFTEATLNFLGSEIRTRISAITGQGS
ncbi:flagellar basal body rod protein FlgB [Polynucleobacter sp. AP-Kolm-20A-A1]|uniref:flagellar basal body rod protein FlgB n=1 Tax=Polynucleobacter sp. AP-Kolm-20A-A1 TaxID=2081041 RepID=UPI001BFE9806|nr:flagellar basal body rod protein FlgB [Polynucleobacter sp. AP-Kolm-20A-A1]QWE19935.1 flagellar basal body rod protein FlgB [Polynucleobacter sp. AP-Kolm-20A-A1]